MMRSFSLLAVVVVTSTMMKTIVAVPSIGVVGVGEDPCQYRVAEVYSQMSFKYLVTPTEFSVIMDYEGSGWMALGITEDSQPPEEESNNLMVDSMAIVGEVANGGEAASVKQYLLTSKGVAGAQDVSDGSVTGSIERNTTSMSTTFKFTKVLRDTDQFQITPGAVETFLWAFGFTDAFPGFHRRRSHLQLDLTPCTDAGGAASADDGTLSSAAQTDPECNEKPKDLFVFKGGAEKRCKILSNRSDRRRRRICDNDAYTAGQVCCASCATP